MLHSRRLGTQDSLSMYSWLDSVARGVSSGLLEAVVGWLLLSGGARAGPATWAGVMGLRSELALVLEARSSPGISLTLERVSESCWRW